MNDQGEFAAGLEMVQMLRADGQFQEAEAVLAGLAPKFPGSAELLALWALTCIDLARFDEALPHFTRAAELAPDNVQYVANVALINMVLGRPFAAEPVFRRALALAPDDPGLLEGLANAIEAQGRFAEVVTLRRRVVEANPANAGAWYNLGNALYQTLQPAAAVDAYNHAILAQPTLAGAHLNRGNALKELGRLEDALAAYRSARAIDPSNPLAASNMLVTLPFLSSIEPDEQLTEFRVIGNYLVAQAKDRVRPHANDRNPDRPIRLGYLSPNFRDHLMARSLLPLVRAHDRTQFEVHIFAHVPRPDAVTEEFQSLATRFTHIDTMSDEHVDEAVRASGIDILVHPMGHWADNRLAALAAKPAPVQVSYLGNSPTTGMSVFDYVITDEILGPDRNAAVMIPEKPIYLTSGFSVYDYGPDIDVGPPPSTLGHPFTFASFNNPQKISDACLALWGRVLTECPDTRLAIKGLNLQDEAAQSGLRARLAGHGIDGNRVVMMGQLDTFAAHLAAFNSVDVVLDTMPFTGGATTLDALWMGVPVVTRAGQLIFGRYSLDFLTRLNATELVANSDDEYVAKAVALARAPDRLKQYRASLRKQMQGSTLLDAARHARELETAFRAMWREWCVRGK